MAHRERTRDGGLGRAVAFGLAPGHDQHRCDAGEVKRHGVVKAGREHRRRPPVVLGRAEHDDGVDRPLVVVAALVPDAVRAVGGQAPDPDDRGKTEAGDVLQQSSGRSSGRDTSCI
jgi:hypothetical protein